MTHDEWMEAGNSFAEALIALQLVGHWHPYVLASMMVRYGYLLRTGQLQ